MREDESGASQCKHAATTGLACLLDHETLDRAAYATAADTTTTANRSVESATSVTHQCQRHAPIAQAA